MLRIMHKSKIQKATITQTKKDYAGSIGIDAILMENADIVPNERVQVLNLDTGIRFETYVIKEQPNSGIICLYGPAAHLGKPGEKVFIISYCLLTDAEIAKIRPKIVYLDRQNRVIERKEKDG